MSAYETRPRRPQSSGRSTVLIIGALILTGGLMLIVPGMLVPSATSSEGADASRATVTPPPSMEVSPFRSVAWEIRRLPRSDDNVLYRLLRLNDRLILVGQGRTALIAWYSDDQGLAWTPARLSGEGPPRDDAVPHVTGIAGRDTRLIASGGWNNKDRTESLESFLLVSDDSGATWRSVPSLPRLEHTEFELIRGVSDRFLGYGFDMQDGTHGWWESTDGITWAPAAVIGLPEGQPPTDLATGALGSAAVGSSSSGTSSTPAVWWSDDAHSWTSALKPGGPAFGFAFRVAAGQHGFAAAGSTWTDPRGDMDAGKATLWRSDDGHTWSAMIMSEDAGRHSGGVAVNNAGIVAILIEPNSANVPDEQLVFVAHGSDVVSAIGAPVSVLDVVATPDQFIALARCQDAPGCTENYLLIGTPSEAAQVAAPTLPLP